MELGSRNALRSQPFRPYSDLLISSVPESRTGWLDGIGDVQHQEASTEYPPEVIAGRSLHRCARCAFRDCAIRAGACPAAKVPILAASAREDELLKFAQARAPTPSPSIQRTGRLR